MDSLRVFTTFKGNSKLRKLSPQRSRSREVGSDGRSVMRERSLVEKPSVSRSVILEKLEKAKGPAKDDGVVKGQRFGDGFMKSGPVKEPKGDVGRNDPRDAMTTEKLKSMLNSNVVNFNGKEKEILSKILGK
jgi:hypothetical protein